MDLIDVLHQDMQRAMDAYGMTDLVIGTVTKVDPLEVKDREEVQPIPQEALRLTAAVIEKKIPILTHKHITAGFRHGHTVSGLGHSHTTEDGSTGAALESEVQTGEGLEQDKFTSDERLDKIVCYEDGKPLPVEDGYIILNRALAVGDKVLMLRVARGQQYIILSRVFEREGPGNAAGGKD